jgi:hypothetical protein
LLIWKTLHQTCSEKRQKARFGEIYTVVEERDGLAKLRRRREEGGGMRY